MSTGRLISCRNPVGKSLVTAVFCATFFEVPFDRLSPVRQFWFLERFTGPSPCARRFSTADKLRRRPWNKQLTNHVQSFSQSTPKSIRKQYESQHRWNYNPPYQYWRRAFADCCSRSRERCFHTTHWRNTRISTTHGPPIRILDRRCFRCPISTHQRQHNVSSDPLPMIWRGY